MEGFGEDCTAARERGYIYTGPPVERRKCGTEARFGELLFMVQSTVFRETVNFGPIFH